MIQPFPGQEWIYRSYIRPLLIPSKVVEKRQPTSYMISISLEPSCSNIVWSTVNGYRALSICFVKYALIQQIQTSIRNSKKSFEKIISDINDLAASIQASPPVTFDMVKIADSEFWQGQQQYYVGMQQYLDRRRAIEELDMLQVIF